MIRQQARLKLQQQLNEMMQRRKSQSEGVASDELQKGKPIVSQQGGAKSNKMDVESEARAA